MGLLRLANPFCGSLVAPRHRTARATEEAAREARLARIAGEARSAQHDAALALLSDSLRRELAAAKAEYREVIADGLDPDRLARVSARMMEIRERAATVRSLR